MSASACIDHQRPSINILVVDDDEPTAFLLESILKSDGYATAVASRYQEAEQLLRVKKFDVVLADLCLGSQSGLDLMEGTKTLPHRPLFVFITGHAGIDSAVAATREGAFEYLPKLDDLAQVEELLTSTMKRVEKRLFANQVQSVAPSSDESPTRTLIGRSAKMVDVYRAIARAAAFRGNVLISGKTGTGKELVARAIHENGPDPKKAFIAVNCAALTDTLLESELFGYVKGSFTGAMGNKIGLFEEANGGTLFLDEIGEISLALQVKLLRAIQEGEIKPVGSTQTRKINVRIIAATHRDLPSLVREMTFREDLYYRLKVFSIDVPSLKERREDIPELVLHFVQRQSKALSKSITRIDPEVFEFAQQYDWPGNVRELENAIARAVAAASSDVLFADDLPEDLHLKVAEPETPAGASGVAPTAPQAESQTLDDLERTHIIRVLKSVNYRRGKAAELLGINRVTLYRKAARYGIPLDPDKIRAGVAPKDPIE